MTATYGSFNYGDGTKYGTVSGVPANSLSWYIQVDWDNNGSYESDEAVYMTSIQVSRGRQNWMRSDGNGFEPIQIGSVKLVLDNTSRRYDVFNASSPLYPNVNPGKNVIVKVRDNSSGITYTLLTGFITAIVPGGYSTEPYVTITVEDNLRYLRSTKLNVPLAYSINPYWIIYLYPYDYMITSGIGYSINATITGVFPTVLYLWWLPTDGNPATHLDDVAIATSMYFMVSNTGTFLLKDRIATRAQVVETYQDIDLLKDIAVSQSWTNYANIVRVNLHNYVYHATQILYTMSSPPSIAPGDTYTFTAPYTYGGVGVLGYYDSYYYPITMGSTWCKTNTAADGSGTDASGSCTLSFDVYADKFVVRIKNNYGSAVYPWTFTIHGWYITESPQLPVTYPADINAITSPKQIILDSPFFESATDAAQLAYDLWKKTVSPLVLVITLESQPGKQYTPDLFDVVLLNIPYLNIINQTFRVGGIEHTSIDNTQNCQAIQTKLYLEPNY